MSYPKHHVLVLRGLPGSGKSTYARSLIVDGNGLVAIVSADDYFVDATGTYRHVPAEIGKAHATCFASYLHAMQRKAPLVIVDNTHMTRWEISPYVLGAAAHDYSCSLLAFEVDVEIAIARNIHGVPPETIRAMAKRREKALPYWNETVYKPEAV